VSAGKNIGFRIRRERIALHVSQTLAARKLGRSQKWLSLIETGRLPVDDEKAKKILAGISRIGREVLSNADLDFSDLRFSARRPRSTTKRNPPSRGPRPKHAGQREARKRTNVTSNSEALQRIEEIAEGLRKGN